MSADCNPPNGLASHPATMREGCTIEFETIGDTLKRQDSDIKELRHSVGAEGLLWQEIRGLSRLVWIGFGAVAVISAGVPIVLHFMK